MRTAADIILYCSVLFTAILMLYAGEPTTPSWYVTAIPFLLWTSIPYGILLAFNRLFPSSPRKNGTVLLTAALISGFAIYCLVNAFFLNPDPQSGIVFIFLPLYQIAAAIIGGLISLALLKRSSAPKRKTSNQVSHPTPTHFENKCN